MVNNSNRCFQAKQKIIVSKVNRHHIQRLTRRFEDECHISATSLWIPILKISHTAKNGSYAMINLWLYCFSTQAAGVSLFPKFPE